MVITRGLQYTFFPHALTIVRRIRNKIDGLRNEQGLWCTEPNLLKQMAIDFYSKLFQKEN